MINILTNNKATAYKDVIRQFARIGGEEVSVLPDTPAVITQLFRDVNYTNGRLIIMRPSFIPSPSFFEELDYFYNQGVHIIVPRAYQAVFNPGEDTPYRMDEQGICKDFVVFQLMGQKSFVLPQDFHWEYLENVKRNSIYRIESRYSGSFETGFSLRSTLGDIIPGVTKGGSIVFLGRDDLNRDTIIERGIQRKLVNAAEKALSIWLK